MLPGHEIPDVGRVVERRVGYLVVEKNEDVRPIAERMDPRGVPRDSQCFERVYLANRAFGRVRSRRGDSNP